MRSSKRWKRSPNKLSAEGMGHGFIKCEKRLARARLVSVELLRPRLAKCSLSAIYSCWGIVGCFLDSRKSQCLWGIFVYFKYKFFLIFFKCVHVEIYFKIWWQKMSGQKLEPSESQHKFFVVFLFVLGVSQAVLWFCILSLSLSPPLPLSLLGKDRIRAHFLHLQVGICRNLFWGPL